MMQTVIEHFPATRNGIAQAIFGMLPVPLSDVPFHHDTPAITRYFAEAFPYHVAVHEVSDVVSPPGEYTNAHVHHDCDEINLIISPGKLIYRVELNGEARQAESNSSIWIPRGTVHSANVLQGSGYFITIRIA